MRKREEKGRTGDVEVRGGRKKSKSKVNKGHRRSEHEEDEHPALTSDTPRSKDRNGTRCPADYLSSDRCLPSVALLLRLSVDLSPVQPG